MLIAKAFIRSTFFHKYSNVHMMLNAEWMEEESREASVKYGFYLAYMFWTMGHFFICKMKLKNWVTVHKAHAQENTCALKTQDIMLCLLLTWWHLLTFSISFSSNSHLQAQCQVTVIDQLKLNHIDDRNHAKSSARNGKIAFCSVSCILFRYWWFFKTKFGF